jgi:hypothetical protein
LLADAQFGLIALHRFVASARWRASAGASRLAERSSFVQPTAALEITFLSIFARETS